MGIGLRHAEIRPLTAIRFFAAFHVLTFHSRDLIAGALAGHEWLRNVIDTGPVSVGLFFVLSGFILTYTYLRPDRPIDRRSFWVARFARVYPVYLLALLAYGAVVLARQPWDGPAAQKLWRAAPPVVLLVQSWIPDLTLAWNSPGWSLSAEAFFYLAFPFALPVAARLGRRSLFVALGVLWALALLTPAVFSLLEARGCLSLRVQGNPTGWPAFVAYNPLVRLPEFLFGVAAGRLFLLRQRPAAPAGPVRWASPAAAVAAALALALLACAPALGRHLPAFTYHNGLLAPLWGVLIYALAVDEGLAARLLSARPLVLLGEASYALYLLHVPARLALDRTGLVATSRMASAGLFLGYAAVVVVVSLLVFWLFEEPARRLIRGRFAGPAGAKAPWIGRKGGPG